MPKAKRALRPRPPPMLVADSALAVGLGASFEDLSRLQPADLQRVLREVDSANLAIAMKSASENLRDKIYGSISKRAAESLKEELEMLGPVRLKDVEVAQDAIIQVVRRLEEEGQITLETEEQTVA